MPIEEILISGLSKFESDADNDLTIHMLSNSQSRQQGQGLGIRQVVVKPKSSRFVL
jgi:hypothetical protein